MPLENPTWVNDFITTNPETTDDIAEGDDHIRNLKNALKTTFPNASKAFRFPTSATKSSNATLVSSDQNSLQLGDATSGGITLTLPSLAAGDAGWEVIVTKIDSSANTVTVAGTINGLTNVILGTQYSFVHVKWTGSAWVIVSKDPGHKVLTKTATYTVIGADLDGVLLVSPASNATINLPAAAGKTGKWLLVKRSDAAFTVTLDGNASETIDGATTFALKRLQSVLIMSDGTNWQIMAQWGGPGSDIPAGFGGEYWGATAPAGWLECFGQAISRTTFSDLFAAISTTHGAGDGSTTFNLPDCRGRVTAGEDDMGGSSANRLTSPINGDTLGATGGGETQTLTEPNLPVVANHTHFEFTTADGGSQVSVTNDAQVGREGSFSSEKSYNMFRSTSAATVGLSSAAGGFGSGTGHANIQPTIIGKKIIKY